MSGQKVHGTEGGAKMHRRHGEKPCPTCLEAERAGARRRAAAKRPPDTARAVLASSAKPTPKGRMAWSDAAKCKGTGVEVWVPDEAEEVTDWHRELCRACPVYVDCLMWAVKGCEYGVWAATTTDERKALRKWERNSQRMAAKRLKEAS